MSEFAIEVVIPDTDNTKIVFRVLNAGHAAHKLCTALAAIMIQLCQDLDVGRPVFDHRGEWVGFPCRTENRANVMRARYAEHRVFATLHRLAKLFV